MVLNADTDGDLRAVTNARTDARGTPAPTNEEDSSWADFAGLTSRELGRTARRLIDALAHRTDENAVAELRRLSDLLSRVPPETQRRPPPVQRIDSVQRVDSVQRADSLQRSDSADRTDPGREPVWDHWFR